MAESRKTAAPVKSKEKDSLLDLDIDKDFLGSWKSMSMGDDGMNFDFGPSTSGKKKAFKFDKMDMDFSIDADFDKLSSFKMDMPSLDIGSPTKKSGTSKESSKEASSGGEHPAKRNSFAFSFDFDEFAGLDFEPKMTKTDDNSKKSKDKEGFLNTSGSGGSRDLLANHVDASEDDDISLKHSASRVVSISEIDDIALEHSASQGVSTEIDTQMENIKASEAKHVDASEDDDTSLKFSAPQGVSVSNIDTQMENIKDPDPRNEDAHLTSVGDERCLLKPEIAKEQDIQKTISSEKIMSCSLQEPIQESHLLKMQSSPEPHAQQVAQDSYGKSIIGDVTTEVTFSDVPKDESRTKFKMVSLRTGDEQNDNVRPLAESAPTCSLSVENLSADMNSLSQHIRMCEARDDNVLVGHIDDDDTNKVDSYVESSMIPGIKILAPEEMNDKRNADFISKFHMGTHDSGSTIDKLVSEKERGNIPVRSKYFERKSGSDSELQQSSNSSTKLISIGDKNGNTLLNNPPLENRCVASRSLPKMLSRDIPVQTKNTETGHVKGLHNTRECLNADNTEFRNEPSTTTVADDIDPTMKQPVSRGSNQNMEHIVALRSNVHPSSSIEQSNKILLQNSPNPSVQVKSMTSTHNMRKIAVEKDKTTPTQAAMRVSEVSPLRVSRDTELKLRPLNCMSPKSLTSMRNRDQGVELQVKMSKRNLSVDMKKQTPLTPTLKRKSFEGSSETPRLTPLKRLSASPFSNNIRELPEKAVEEQVRMHASMVDEKSPRFGASQTEMDISSEIENDSNFEKAEACSKELEDICNMLKKKHEEAKDILVRAIVNNNNLLMLNYPIYEDKLRMVQKFAAMLMSK